MIGVTQAGNSEFLSEQGIKDLLLNATILVLVATGQSLVVDHPQRRPVGRLHPRHHRLRRRRLSRRAAATRVVAVAARRRCSASAAGCVNGLLVSLGQVPALVVTLGTLYIIRGVDSIWVGSRQITAADLPGGFVDFGTGGISARAVPGADRRSRCSWRPRYYLAALRQRPRAVRARLQPGGRPAGRHPGPQADPRRVHRLRRPRRARRRALPGPVRQRRLRHRHGYELTVVSAVVVGGVVFTGGSGSVYGAALGALLLTSINSVLPALGVSSVWVLAINGILLCSPSRSTGSSRCAWPSAAEEEERPPWLTSARARAAAGPPRRAWDTAVGALLVVAAAAAPSPSSTASATRSTCRS